jgi:hypothetical protein
MSELNGKTEASAGGEPADVKAREAAQHMIDLAKKVETELVVFNAKLNAFHDSLSLLTAGLDAANAEIARLVKRQVAMDAALKNHEDVLGQIPGVEVHRPGEGTPPVSQVPN